MTRAIAVVSCLLSCACAPAVVPPRAPGPPPSDVERCFAAEPQEQASSAALPEAARALVSLDRLFSDAVERSPDAKDEPPHAVDRSEIDVSWLALPDGVISLEGRPSAMWNDLRRRSAERARASLRHALAAGRGPACGEAARSEAARLEALRVETQRERARLLEQLRPLARPPDASYDVLLATASLEEEEADARAIDSDFEATTFAQARRLFERAAAAPARAPRLHFWAHYGVARVAQMLGDEAGEKNAYRAILAAETPTPLARVEAHYRLGEVARREGACAEASEAYRLAAEEAIDARASYATTFWILATYRWAEAEGCLGHTRRAIDLAARVFERTGDVDVTREVVNLLGRMLARLEKGDRAGLPSVPQPVFVEVGRALADQLGEPGTQGPASDVVESSAPPSVSDAQRVVALLMPRLRRCMARAGGPAPRAAGPIALAVEIDGSGRVTRAAVRGGGGLSPAVVACLEAAAAQTTFRAPGGRGASIEIPINL